MTPSHHSEIDTLLTTAQAKAALGIGTTTLYKLIGAGHLDARKLGSNTRITERSIRAFQASLPKAVITTGRGCAA